MKKLSLVCVALCVSLLTPAAFARGGGMGSMGSHASISGGGALGTSAATPGTNSLGTVLYEEQATGSNGLGWVSVNG